MILVYDTETTGLWVNGRPVDHPSQPKIVQLSALLVSYNGLIADKMDLVVKPNDWVIPEQSSAIHGITHANAHDIGHELEDVLRRFNDLVKHAERLVGHNEAFDFNVVSHGLKLIKRKIEFPKARSCTMMMATPVVKQPSKSGKGYKWPSLQDTYEFLFGRKFEGAHNSLYDCHACLEVYKELKNRGVHDAEPVKPRTDAQPLDQSTDYGRSYKRLQEIIQLAHDNEGVLSDWEREQFLPSIVERIEEYKEKTFISHKQWGILERIEEKLL